ncbi:hypothetical protein BIT28_01355 [Photobacterium proteolyticum]|uniref:Uncharacterized protein n=1 Tax=Photobacterium proteolyticum TaxID=1903952 RepID=A0A1Q9GXD3_9GAMM|nr:hypothetical protein [Photobacterium proteolyticum]OLQ79926.1 hypothetical protein BIT28_01355 [Photobacterium proteolyticum]
MKRYLLTVALLTSSAAIAAPDYDSCINNSNTEVCQAYLAGLSHGKASVEDTAMIEQEETFRSRALEQRVGERYRKTVQFEKKSIQSTN